MHTLVMSSGWLSLYAYSGDDDIDLVSLRNESYWPFYLL